MKRLLLTLLLIPTAHATDIEMREMFCDDTKEIVKMLKEDYKEMPVITGITDDVAKSIMSIWTNPVTDTWTILATHKDYSCVIGTGKNLKVIDYRKKQSV